ncbi:hypothetical protein [Streptomyces roseochromogenus]|uniref:Uncharacterized protein n=1 Tax=Streptomyces roseochromogenus subsp. oscitans DS 12.976 TaxID=1352936 RepID=V6KK81_STRRC|nr:hypothetical protein [Streptomyces roseochromogenus]EST32438.1 hypothetical protein M878_14750 [Streptomyces roseochromogenus subsp. oscitans DS 12.976]
MAYDPTEPDAAEEDLETDQAESDVEAPEADAAEQHTDLSPEHDDPLTGVDQDRANVADLVEQARVVSLDEDDYR